MQIKLASVMVKDQEQALRFYVDKLGFRKKADISMGGFRWLTLASPDGLEGAELVLDPMQFPPARDYQRALYEAGIPAAAFFTADLNGEYARLQGRGVAFKGEPQKMGAISSVLFDDSCGNWINLVQPA
jgi:catechol 2,3-dioxygenase-like lactoylglutathione lyase family enzyme